MCNVGEVNLSVNVYQLLLAEVATSQHLTLQNSFQVKALSTLKPYLDELKHAVADHCLLGIIALKCKSKKEVFVEFQEILRKHTKEVTKCAVIEGINN